MKPRNKTVNYKTLEYIQNVINPHVKILDLEVCNKYLVATLSSGIFLWIVNNYFEKE